MLTWVHERSVWVCVGASWLDKHRCTVQLTLFADGEPRVNPLLIFRVQEKITLSELVQYDRRVVVKFQPNAWWDEDMMKFWVRQIWAPICDGPMHLILDVHRAQTTEDIKTILHHKSTHKSAKLRTHTNQEAAQAWYNQ